jgi:hypothetical protein
MQRHPASADLFQTKKNAASSPAGSLGPILEDFETEIFYAFHVNQSS